MKIITELMVYICVAFASMVFGYSTAKDKYNPVGSIDVDAKGFGYIVSVPKGKSITLRAPSEREITVVPDAKYFIGENHEDCN